MVTVASLMQPTRVAGVDHIEELAARIAAGQAVAPEEVLAVLDRCRCGEEDLQHAVDRHARVIELRRVIATAGPIEKRLAAIEAEVQGAEDEVKAARAKLSALVGRVNDEHLELRHRADAIDRARRSLMLAENLPPRVAERLRVVRDASDEATDALTACERDLAERRSRLGRAEEELPKAEREASLRSGSDDARAEAERWRNAVKARREQVAEAEKALAEAKRAQASAVAARDAAERDAVAMVQSEGTTGN